MNQKKTIIIISILLISLCNLYYVYGCADSCSGNLFYACGGSCSNENVYEDDGITIRCVACGGDGCTNVNNFNPDCADIYPYGEEGVDLDDVLNDPDGGVSYIIDNFEKINQNLQTLTPNNMDSLEDAIMNKISSSSSSSFDLSMCIDSDACSTIPGEDKFGLTVGSVSIDFNSIQTTGNGFDITARTDDDFNGFELTLPGGSGPLTFTDNNGVTHSFQSESGDTALYGNVLSLNTGTTYSQTTGSGATITGYTITAMEPGVEIFTSGCGPGTVGVCIADGTLWIVGVDVSIIHQIEKGTYSILTTNMQQDEYVTIGEGSDRPSDFEPKLDFSADFTNGGQSSIVFNTGQQGIIYNDDTAWACNPFHGSCPRDTDSELVITVKWGDEEPYYGLIMDAQNRLYCFDTEHNSVVTDDTLRASAIRGSAICPFSTCRCDLSEDCDAGCVCDVACMIPDLPLWMETAFGYGNWEKNIEEKIEKCTSDGSCPQPYGSAYHVYSNGLLLIPDDPEYAEILGENGGAQIYDMDGNQVADHFNIVVAFPGTKNHCLGSEFSSGNICPKEDPDFSDTDNLKTNCGSCLVTCLESGNECSKEEFTLTYYNSKTEFQVTPDQYKNYDKSMIYLDLYCKEHTGYCDMIIPTLNIDSITVPSNGNKNIDLDIITLDEHPYSITYDIIGGNGQGCTIINSGQNTCPDQTNYYTKKVLSCANINTGFDLILKLTDECGLTSAQTIKINGGGPGSNPNICLNNNEKRCHSTNEIQICDDDDNDGDLEWRIIQTCSANQGCSVSGSPHVYSCVDIECNNNKDCTDDGNSCTLERCNNPGLVTSACVHDQKTCSAVSDGCCPQGCTVNTDIDCYVCDEANKCQTQGNEKCSGAKIQECNYHHLDNCLEWGDTEDCSADGKICDTENDIGQCIDVTCTSDDSCPDDNSPCTEKKCQEIGTPQAHCEQIPKQCNTVSDGCCPIGCTEATDPDCVSCDDNSPCENNKICCGIDENNKFCTVATCTVDNDCNDNDPCTVDVCENNGACTSECIHVKITDKINDDQCCPEGAVYSEDNDCSINCRNFDTDQDSCEDQNDKCGWCPLNNKCYDKARVQCTQAGCDSNNDECINSCILKPNTLKCKDVNNKNNNGDNNDNNNPSDSNGQLQGSTGQTGTIDNPTYSGTNNSNNNQDNNLQTTQSPVMKFIKKVLNIKDTSNQNSNNNGNSNNNPNNNIINDPYCNQNGICDNQETGSSCPSDCGFKDGPETESTIEDNASSTWYIFGGIIMFLTIAGLFLSKALKIKSGNNQNNNQKSSTKLKSSQQIKIPKSVLNNYEKGGLSDQHYEKLFNYQAMLSKTKKRDIVIEQDLLNSGISKNQIEKAVQAIINRNTQKTSKRNLRKKLFNKFE